MNETVGKLSSAIMIGALLGMMVGAPIGFSGYGMTLFYCAVIVITLTYLPMCCAICNFGKGSKTAVFCSVSFAILYVTFGLIVVILNILIKETGYLISQDFLQYLNYNRLGISLRFDILPFCLLSGSTVFASLTVGGTTKRSRWLKYLLLLHGTFILFCLFAPWVNIINPVNAIVSRTLLTELWCVLLGAISFLSYLRFRGKKH